MNSRSYIFHRRRQAGFTLMEAALTTMIIGIGLVATLQLLAAGTSSNVQGAATTTSVNLAKNVRELTLKLTFDEVRALHGRSYNPPVDSRGDALVGFDQWRQTVRIQPVDRDRLTLDIIEPNPHVVRVTVTVSKDGSNVSHLNWYRFRPMP